jgi:hypothetical protein
MDSEDLLNVDGSSSMLSDSDLAAVLAVMRGFGMALPGATAASLCATARVDCAQNRVVRLVAGNATSKGSLSTRIGELTALVALDLSRNADLVGPMPSQMAKLTLLTSLSLWGTKMGNHAPLPALLARLVKLTELRLGQCGFAGPIPAFLSNLSDLRRLHLSENELTGGVNALASLGKLTSLLLYEQSGAGLRAPALPASFAQIGECVFVRSASEASCTNNCGSCCPAAVTARACPAVTMATNATDAPTTTPPTTTTTATATATATARPPAISTVAAGVIGSSTTMASSAPNIGNNAIVIAVVLVVLVALVAVVVTLVCMKRRKDRRAEEARQRALAAR